MSQMTYSDAGKAALAESMRADPTIWVVGEDLGRGGVFGQYMGMEEDFGPERIVSAPISEAAIMGSAVGGALTGTRPVVELRFADFALCAVDEMVNQAAKARYMFGGQAKVPVVIRQPSGMWRSSAAKICSKSERNFCVVSSRKNCCFFLRAVIWSRISTASSESWSTPHRANSSPTFSRSY